MKISRNKLKQLVEQSMKKMVKENMTKEESDAKWEKYVDVGKSEDEKNERRKIWILWEMWTGATPASFALEKAKLPVNPTQYLSGYEGWNEWYKDVVKNKEAMDAMGRKVNTYFSVSDHFKYIAKFFPEEAKLPSMKLEKAKLDKQVVDEFMSGINYGDSAKSKKPEEMKEEENIFGFKETQMSDMGGLRQQSFDQWLLTRADPPSFSQIPSEMKKAFPLTVLMYTKAPTEFYKLAKGEDVDDEGLAKVEAAKKGNGESSLSDEDKAALARIKKGELNIKASPVNKPASKEDQTKMAGGTEKESEKDRKGIFNRKNKKMDENRIRAIIRHELIQSMKK